MSFIFHYMSPLGPVTLASDGSSLTGLWFDGQKYYGSTLSREPQEASLPVLRDTVSWLDRYFSGIEPGPTPPIRLEGTAFQESVWQLLRDIPYGQTVTYGQIAGALAAQIGKNTMSAQAVGGAVGRNPVSILVPCHRVVGAHGALTGYAGGLERKQFLLELEQRHANEKRTPV